MKNLILIGMMGCGKTTVGRLVADELNLKLVDTDEHIQLREGRSIPDIFAREGEARFREMELEICRELRDREDLVIACGGGMPLQEPCMEALRQNGLVFWLNRDPGLTWDTLDISGRPLAQQGREAFLARYASRMPVYRRWADEIVQGEQIVSPGMAAEAIISIYNRRVVLPWIEGGQALHRKERAT